MSDIFLAFASGITFGAVWLGVLWLSVSAAARRRAAWPVFAGLAVRLGLLGLAGLVFLKTGGDGFAGLAALLGFAVVRTIAVWRMRIDPAKEAPR